MNINNINMFCDTMIIFLIILAITSRIMKNNYSLILKRTVIVVLGIYILTICSVCMYNLVMWKTLGRIDEDFLFKGVIIIIVVVYGLVKNCIMDKKKCN